jgi:hypothetical protein
MVRNCEMHGDGWFVNDDLKTSCWMVVDSTFVVM